MSVQATNLHLMSSWELAYAFAGEAVLPLFGLSGSDIDAVLTVDLATRSRWAATSPAFALPRPGLRAGGLAVHGRRVVLESGRVRGHARSRSAPASDPVS